MRCEVCKMVCTKEQWLEHLSRHLREVSKMLNVGEAAV